MAVPTPPLTLGVEEEYLLVDKETRGLVVDPPQTLMAEAGSGTAAGEPERTPEPHRAPDAVAAPPTWESRKPLPQRSPSSAATPVEDDSP